MGFWSELGKVALESLESHAILQDPDSHERMRGHMKRLYAINAHDSNDGLVNIVGDAWLTTKKNTEYLSQFDRKELMALSMFAKGQRDRAKEVSDQDRHDSDAGDFARYLSNISDVIEAHLRTYHSVK